MVLRPAAQADLPAVLDLFHESVHTLRSGDYTLPQLSAWAPEDVDKAPWLRCQTVLPAEDSGGPAGFAALEDYLDLLYVHPLHARRGATLTNYLMEKELIPWT